MPGFHFLYLFPLQCSSFSTITESTMSLNIITVTLNMGKTDFKLKYIHFLPSVRSIHLSLLFLNGIFPFVCRKSKFSRNKYCWSKQQKRRWGNLCWFHHEGVSVNLFSNLLRIPNSSNNSRGRLFIFYHSKRGWLFEVGDYFKYCSLEVLMCLCAN